MVASEASQPKTLSKSQTKLVVKIKNSKIKNASANK